MILDSGWKKRLNKIPEVGKNKLARWAELETFINVIQPGPAVPVLKDHILKGKWNQEIFRNSNPVILELGCGKGEYTLGLSGLLPECNFIGVDIKGARLWRGAKTANEKQRKNTAFLRTRIEFINFFFGPDEVDEIWITFPDPHPGKKNSNKRLTCPWFLNTYRNFLKDRGIIHLKTDNEELYNYTNKLARDNALEILLSAEDMDSLRRNGMTVPGDHYSFPDDPDYMERISNGILSIRTHYELKFMEKGLKINYFAFRLEKDKFIYHGWEKTKQQ
jgi:tRNA (guanine-N7-)-methyltransferase